MSAGIWFSALSNSLFTRRADRRLPPGCYGNLIVNVKCGQSRPKRASGVDPTDTIGPRSRSRLSPRFACESDRSRLAAIIVDVPVAVENLPVVWKTSRDLRSVRTSCKPFWPCTHVRPFFPLSVRWLRYRRLPGCVVMGINRTRRLFGRQKKDAWAANQYTLYGFRPRRSRFLSPLFLFF